MTSRHLIAVLGIAACCCSARAASNLQDDNQAVPIGSIDFFGYGGLNLHAVQEHLPIQTGDSFTYETFKLKRPQIEKSVQEVTGKSPTDVALVCCDQASHLLVYIGLAGTSSRPLSVLPALHGDEHLDPTAMELYEQVGEALEMAIKRGASGEDWSQGYALSADPATRELQIKVRAYALDREQELEKILQNSGDAQQRSVSAYILGYSKQSPTQMQSLAKASLDSNEEVRNNAIRALSVLSSGKTASLKIDPEPFINLLLSGKWTDRNKSSLLLVKLTASRDPATLDKLRQTALQPLIEGAEWQSQGHSTPFLMILGRIANLPDDEIENLITTGNKDKIIQAAETRSTATVGSSRYIQEPDSRSPLN